jgi:hypothetical protein
MIIHHTDRVTTPGLYRMSAAAYRRDPCPTRSLSSGVLHTLLTKSPLHARAKYRRPEPAALARMDFGSGVHKLALECGADIVTVDANDWRTNAAKEQREVAYANGQIPLLGKDYERAKQVSGPLRLAIENFTGVPMADCHREIVGAWQENGGWHRIQIDVMTPDLRTLVDAKTTKASVAPIHVERRIYDAYNIQQAFYLRGMDAIDPDNAGRREFYFMFGEVDEPFAVSPPMKLSEAGAQMSREQVEHGMKYWASCLATDTWPGYSVNPCIAEPPPWVLTQWQAGVIAGRDEEEQEGES